MARQPDVVRNRLAVALLAGLLSVIGRFLSADLLEDPWKAGADAAFDALVVIVVGVGVATVLERRATDREADRRRAARVRLLELLGPNLGLAATGWVHRPDSGEDVSVGAGIAALNDACTDLEEIELGLRELRDTSWSKPPWSESDPSRVYYLSNVRARASRYWGEGVRRIRIRHLTGVRSALEAQLVDADEPLRDRFVRFAGALDLADAAALKTDQVVQQRLVADLIGATIERSWQPMDPAVSEPIRVAADLAAGAIDSVLQIAVVADLLQRRIPEPLPETWADDVQSALHRCVGALVHEVANVRITLELLRGLVESLIQTHASLPSANSSGLTSPSVAAGSDAAPVPPSR